MMKRVWFLTGSSRGLGLSIARAVLEHGDTLVATARNPGVLDDLKQQYGQSFLPLALDVRDPARIRAAVAETMASFGRIDVVVNNAGYGNIATIEEASDEEFRDQIDTDLWGVIHVTRAVLPILRRQRSGHIFQISSVGGRVGNAGLGPYQTSKWGVEGFSEVLAKEVASFGVKVTIVEPGHMPTDWAGSSMKVAEPGEDYRPAMAWRMEMLERLRGLSAQPMPGSNPDKVARVLVELVGTSEPPLRLLMGSASVAMVLAADEARLAETKKWQSLSSSTDL
jgi:NAD(P)-dependent dehydrogenase (short-subunit alcohol dehydrogenase family)